MNQRICRLVTAGLLVALLVPGLGGCFFTPRTPAEPSGGTVVYLPRSSPQNVWTNAERSLQNKDAFGWGEAINDAFTYFPDDAALIDFPGLADWNKTKEMTFINAFYNADVTIQPQMTDDDFVIPEVAGTEVTWENIIYYIRVTSNVDDSVTKYRASAEITFKLDGSFWYISSWRDIGGEADPDNETIILPSMGVLRGTFGSK